MNPALLAGMGAAIADPRMRNQIQNPWIGGPTTGPIRHLPTTGPGSGGEINQSLGRKILPTLVGQIGNIPGVPTPVRFAGDVLSQLLSMRPTVVY